MKRSAVGPPRLAFDLTTQVGYQAAVLQILILILGTPSPAVRAEPILAIPR
jgi:hypothetical protein